MESHTSNVEMAIKEAISKHDIKNDAIERLGSIVSGDPVSFFILLKRSIEDGGNISNLLFYNKLETFLIDISAIDYEKRIKFLDKYVNEKENQFYHRLVLLLNAIDDLYKPHILSNLFHALCYEKIDLGMFFRLSNILSKLYIGDILFLFERRENLGIDGTIELHSLEMQGLVISNQSLKPFCLSEYGKLFIDYGLMNGVCEVFSKLDSQMLKSNLKINYNTNHGKMMFIPVDNN